MQQQSFENWNNTASDDDYEKLKDAMVLLIEKAIADDGNEDWQRAIPAPYDTNMVKESAQNALEMHADEKCTVKVRHITVILLPVVYGKGAVL